MDRIGNMRFKLETMSNRAFWGLMGIFVLLCIICLIIGGTGPQRFYIETKPAFSCVNGSENYNSSLCTGVNIGVNGSIWSGGPQFFSVASQQMIVFMTLHNKQSSAGLNAQLTIMVTITGSNANPNTNATYKPVSVSTHTRTINCPSGQLYCNNITLIQLVNIQYNFYNFSVQLMGITPTINQFIGNADFSFIYYSAVYSQFGLGVRYFFIVLNVIFGIYFLNRLKAYRWATDWIIEQKWTILLLLFLFLLNNPFYALNVVSGRWFPQYMDVLFTIGFFSVILLFFLCIFDSLRKPRQQRTLRAFYLPKVLYLGVFYLLNFISLTYLEAQSLNDPMFNIQYDTPGFSGFGYFIFAYTAIYIFWLLYYLIRLFKERNTIVIPNVGPRYKFITIFTVCIALATIIGSFLSFQFSQNSSIQLLAYYGLFNFYIYFLVLVYIPVKQVSNIDNGRGMVKMTDDVENFANK